MKRVEKENVHTSGNPITHSGNLQDLLWLAKCCNEKGFFFFNKNRFKTTVQKYHIMHSKWPDCSKSTQNVQTFHIIEKYWRQSWKMARNYHWGSFFLKINNSFRFSAHFCHRKSVFLKFFPYLSNPIIIHLVNEIYCLKE